MSCIVISTEANWTGQGIQTLSIPRDENLHWRVRCSLTGLGKVRNGNGDTCVYYSQADESGSCLKVMKDETIIDSDGNTYANEGAFLAHACEMVSRHLKKFSSMDWWEWRDELCWWDEEMDERLSAGDISEWTHEKFVECLYGGLNDLNTHIW